MLYNIKYFSQNICIIKKIALILYQKKKTKTLKKLNNF